ncbi:leucine-rich repeat flightless-interacting protein 2-like isoform X2 [Limulus polyphemus]|uniref:Leucine-rich repeat flightless-interacting protein 2-like isoform X2 n=1 Tax=Limulus polyphemus TaxID=6850 RepID=A0ABM1BV30_LIMPO|nr:leucine-rich repeat flightless-interacting protein 2-like isoform X2 [Limulus polyphemus]
MATVGSGRKRVTTKLYSAEDQALDQIAREAEARLAARRQARAEAREIRMRELEKQQKEADQQSDRHYELLSDPVRGRPSREGRSLMSGTPSFTSSRRSSEDSTEAVDNSRELRHQLQDLEEKFKKAMVSNAQLDNEKSTLTYNVDTLKDEIEELEENFIQIQKEHKDKSRAYDQLNRDFKEIKEEIEFLRESLRQRDELIEEHGLVLVGEEEIMVNGDDDCNSLRSTPDSSSPKTVGRAALVSQEAAQLLEQAGEGSLDVRLKRFAEEKQELLDEIHRLKFELEEEKQKTAKMEQLTLVHGPQSNGPEMKLLEVQREANKQVSDYKFKLKKAEQENSTLQSSVSRLESQVIRYKTAAENAEKVEDELKAEKRKLQREVREAQAKIEELETANAHLQKRIDKLKSARNALVK